MEKAESSSPLIKVFPSILSADFGRLNEEVQRAERAGADGLHLDVMDGHFVPNLSFGSQIVTAIRKTTTLFLDVHLMVYRPYDYIESFVKAGANRITIHCEATEDVKETVSYIHTCGVKAGVALCPETSTEMILHSIPWVDVVLVMTVTPGFGGQQFLSDMFDKIATVRAMVNDINPATHVEVDGGLNQETAPQCREAGADQIVSGEYLYRSHDMKEAIATLRGAR